MINVQVFGILPPSPEKQCFALGVAMIRKSAAVLLPTLFIALFTACQWPTAEPLKRPPSWDMDLSDLHPPANTVILALTNSQTPGYLDDFQAQIREQFSKGMHVVVQGRRTVPPTADRERFDITIPDERLILRWRAVYDATAIDNEALINVSGQGYFLMSANAFVRHRGNGTAIRLSGNVRFEMQTGHQTLESEGTLLDVRDGVTGRINGNLRTIAAGSQPIPPLGTAPTPSPVGVVRPHSGAVIQLTGTGIEGFTINTLGRLEAASDTTVIRMSGSSVAANIHGSTTTTSQSSIFSTGAGGPAIVLEGGGVRLLTSNLDIEAAAGTVLYVHNSAELTFTHGKITTTTTGTEPAIVLEDGAVFHAQVFELEVAGGTALYINDSRALIDHETQGLGNDNHIRTKGSSVPAVVLTGGADLKIEANIHTDSGHGIEMSGTANLEYPRYIFQLLAGRTTSSGNSALVMTGDSTAVLRFMPLLVRGNVPVIDLSGNARLAIRGGQFIPSRNNTDITGAPDEMAQVITLTGGSPTVLFTLDTQGLATQLGLNPNHYPNEAGSFPHERVNIVVGAVTGARGVFRAATDTPLFTNLHWPIGNAFNRNAGHFNASSAFGDPNSNTLLDISNAAGGTSRFAEYDFTNHRWLPRNP